MGKIHRRRNREVGQSNPSSEDQGGVEPSACRMEFHKSRSANPGGRARKTEGGPRPGRGGAAVSSNDPFGLGPRQVAENSRKNFDVERFSTEEVPINRGELQVAADRWSVAPDHGGFAKRPPLRQSGDCHRWCGCLKPLRLYRFCAGDHYGKGKSIWDAR